MTTRQNLNVDTLEGLRGFLKANPDKGKLHLEAKAVYEGQVGRSTVHIGPFAVDDTTIDSPKRHYSFPLGARREVEDMIGIEASTDRMEPVEMVLASTAACLVYSITLNAARLGIDTGGLEITVRTTVDPRVLLAIKGPEEQRSCLGTIEYDVKVSGTVSDEEMETIHKLCRYSPVHGMMSESVSIKGEVTRA